MNETPKISVCVSTWRAGCFDPLIRALVLQKDAPPFELIFSDAHYAVRSGVTAWANVRQYGLFFRITHLKVDDALWPNGCDASRGFNTCLRRATGELVVWLTDHSVPPPDFLAKHWALYEKTGGKALGRSPYIARLVPEEAWAIPLAKESWTPDSMREWASQPATAWSLFKRPIDNVTELPEAPIMRCPVRQGPVAPGSRVPNEWFWHYKSESMPLAALKAVNGFDEDYDPQYNHRDTDLALRLLAAGYYGVVVDSEVSILDAHPVSPRPRVSGNHDTAELLTRCRDRIRRGIVRCDNGIVKETNT